MSSTHLAHKKIEHSEPKPLRISRQASPVSESIQVFGAAL